MKIADLQCIERLFKVDKKEVAKFILEKFTKAGVKQISDKDADVIIFRFAMELIEKKKDWVSAATTIWGSEIFQAQANSVKLIWDNVINNSKVLIMGAGSMGKSYTTGVWLILDFLRDPLNTTIKIISVSREHALRNIFAHTCSLYRNARIALPGNINARSIMCGDNDKFGIHLVAIGKDDAGSGALRGFHPSPRIKPHPIFGTMTRIRAMLDEAELIPYGVWDGIDNMLISKEGDEHIKVVAATNPEDPAKPFGLRARPVNGWDSLDIDASESWSSEQGWRVVRLDGAKCENVLEKKIIYKGLLTIDGFESYSSSSGVSKYYTMARGFYPPTGTDWTIISAELFSKQIGTYTFSEYVWIAGIDVSLDGGDKLIVTLGKFGSVDGNYRLQAEQQFSLSKGDTISVTKDIIRLLEDFNVKGENIAIDCTGIGRGVSDLLKLKYGSIIDVNYGESATNMRISANDSIRANTKVPKGRGSSS